MKKQIIALLSAATMLGSALPMGMAGAAGSERDYYARGFAATDNGNLWAGCAQISWFNPAEKPEKVSLYASGKVQGEGNYVLIGDDYDTTANASIVTTLPTVNWSVTPRDCWYNFKLVSAFAGGKTTEQTLDFYVPDVNKPNDWSISTDISDDFKTVAQRGGWCYTHGAGQNHDFFPMGASVVYEKGNPALKVWSNAHIMDHVDETRDGVTNNSGNYYGNLILKTAVESGESYDVSFRYKAKGTENIRTKVNGSWLDGNIEDTNDEWVNYSATVTSAVSAGMLNFEFKVGNEAFIIDDVIVKKNGTDENLLSDGDFSKLAATAPADVTRANKIVNGGKSILSWMDSANATGVNIYKVVNGEEIKAAYVRNSKQTITFDGDGEYIAKAVNAKGAESAGVKFEAPKYLQYEIAAEDFTATTTRNAGQLLITWKNSAAKDIQSVTLSDSAGSVIGSYSTDPGAFNSQLINDLTDYMYYTYTLTTVTKSGDKIEQYVSGTPFAMDNNVWDTTSDITSKVKIHRSRGTLLSCIHPEILSENGNTYLKVQNENTSAGFGYGFVRLNVNMEPETTYTLSYKIKGALPSWAKIWIYNGADCRQEWANAGGIVKFENWTEKSHTFTTTSAAQTRSIEFELNGISNGLPVYMDDIVLKKGDTVVYSEDFEGTEIHYPQTVNNVSVKAKDDSAVLSWDAVSMDDGEAKVVRVFAEQDGHRYLAAVLPPDVTTCEIKNLNGQYTFALDIMTEEGNKSYERTVSATVEKIYKVTTPVLTDAAGTPITADAIAAGDYKVSADVTNYAAGDNFSAQVIVALYDGTTFVTSAISNVETIAEGESTAVESGTITVPETEGHNYALKAFVWSSLSGMKPLCGDKAFFE